MDHGLARWPRDGGNNVGHPSRPPCVSERHSLGPFSFSFHEQAKVWYLMRMRSEWIQFFAALMAFAMAGQEHEERIVRNVPRPAFTPDWAEPAGASPAIST